MPAADQPPIHHEPSDTTEPFLVQLETVLAARLAQRPANSYVAELAAGGHPAMASKIVEEAYELVAAAADRKEAGTTQAVVHEAADLVFHVMVLLGHHNVTWSEIEDELRGRFGIGGKTEKQTRKSAPE